MNTSFEERKEKSVEIMKQLDIYKPYIEGFKQNNEICYFENFAGFWVWQDEELEKKIKEIETKYNATIFAITHEFTSFGECYDFLLVTDYKEEWNDLVYHQSKNQFVAFAYVWNKTCESDSELGSIGIECFGGGIRRFC